MKTATDPIISDLLSRLSRWEMGAAEVLADYLVERDHPKAARVMALVEEWRRHCSIVTSPTCQPRLRFSRPEEFTIWCRIYRKKIGRVFGKKWKNEESVGRTLRQKIVVKNRVIYDRFRACHSQSQDSE